MSARTVAGIGAAIFAMFLTCGGLLVAVVGGTASAGCTATPGPSASLPAGRLNPHPGGMPTIGTWNHEQVSNAAIIVSVGAHMGVPARGWVIAVATAIQESSLINLPDLGDANNADSLGLFQQRPSQGWGTPAQIMDPVYASTTFYEHLLAVPGWQTMPLTQAAQAVQKSATPDAYARWEQDATRIVAVLTGVLNPDAPGNCAGQDGQLLAPPPGFSLPAGTPPAVATAISWAFAQLGTPYAFGGDCTNAHSGNPAHQCDCSSLVILSPTILRGCDLRFRVEDGVVDAVVAGVFDEQPSGGSSPRCDAVGSLGSAGVVRLGPEDALALGATR
jgi:hypothetical protein